MIPVKITFLGASHGYPEPNRRCSCAMLDLGGKIYFIDMGVMALEDLVTRGISPDAVKGIFITHMHGDHTNGLVHFVDLISWKYKTVDPVICLPSLQGVEPMRGWLAANETPMRDLQFREYDSGVIFDDGTLKVTAIPTRHCETSHSFLVEAEGKTVLFTGDLKRPGIDFPEIVKQLHTDLMVCECAHFPATDYIPVLEQCRTDRVCINHHSPRYFNTIAPLTEAISTPLVIAYDGLELNV